MFRRSRRRDEDFGREIEEHIRLEAERLTADGMSREEATAAAQRTFGNMTACRERFYEAGRWMWAERLGKDVGYAMRRMRRAPVAAATVVLSLALGVGFNTSIFSLADQALLRTLPVEKPERLVQLDWKGEFMGAGMGSVGWGSLIPYPLYRELRAENEVFTDLFASFSTDVHLAIGDRSEPVSTEAVTGSYFPTLGVRPALGRLLSGRDDRNQGAHPVVVLSHEYWQNHLGGDPDIIGKPARMNGFAMTVVGVAEQGFHGMDWSQSPAIWVPLMMKAQVTPDWNGLDERRTRFLHVYGRLKPGIGREQAQARIEPWFKAYLAADTRREGWPQASAVQMRDYMASRLDLLPGGRGQSVMRRMIAEPMWILLAATVLILLLACLNVANLSLAGALARRRMTALRTALGASRGRIVAERFVESAVLAAVGCSAGALLAAPVIRAIVSYLPQFGAAGIALSPSLGHRVLWFALAVTAATTLISGIAPALYAASVPPVDALKQQSAAVAGGLALRKALVVGQFALALILLIGAGLFTRTLGALRAEGAGFPTANLLMFRLAPLSDGYPFAQTKPLFRTMLATVQTLPEIERAGLGRWEMLRGGGWNNPVTIQSGRRFATRESLDMNAVTPDFFRTLGAAVTRGRAFDEHDSVFGTKWVIRSAIVNEEFVKEYLPEGNPLGARIGIGSGPGVVADKEIVGVVKNFHNAELRAPAPQVYFPLWERTVEEGTFYVRARSSAEAAERSIREAVARIDPRLTVMALRTMDDQLDRMLIVERLLAVLAGAFAGVATLLAMIGLYGVLAFSAASRGREIGIRMALGASRWAAGGLILREAALLAAAGMAIALPVSWAMGRLVESQLFGVRPMDGVTIAAAAAILFAVCLGASAVPARRAVRLNPLDTLRSE